MISTQGNCLSRDGIFPSWKLRKMNGVSLLPPVLWGGDLSTWQSHGYAGPFSVSGSLVKCHVHLLSDFLTLFQDRMALQAFSDSSVKRKTSKSDKKHINQSHSLNIVLCPAWALYLTNHIYRSPGSSSWGRYWILPNYGAEN